MKVKKNDTVVVLTGKDVKKTGKVLMAFPKTNKIVVEGVNIQEKNKKARSAQDVSEKIKKEGPIDASNVLVICPVCGKATRVGYAIVDGKKVRVCKKCSASLDAKVVKAEAKKKTTKKATKEDDVVTTPATEEVKPVRKRKTTTKTAEETAVAVAEEPKVVEEKPIEKKTTTRKTTTKKAEDADGEAKEVKKTTTRKTTTKKVEEDGEVKEVKKASTRKTTVKKDEETV